MTDPIQIKHYKEDITSFNQLYKEFQRRFVRFANTYVRDLTTAEDITIEDVLLGKQAILKRRFQYSSLYLNNYKKQMPELSASSANS